MLRRQVRPASRPERPFPSTTSLVISSSGSFRTCHGQLDSPFHFSTGQTLPTAATTTELPHPYGGALALQASERATTVDVGDRPHYILTLSLLPQVDRERHALARHKLHRCATRVNENADSISARAKGHDTVSLHGTFSTHGVLFLTPATEPAHCQSSSSDCQASWSTSRSVDRGAESVRCAPDHPCSISRSMASHCSTRASIFGPSASCSSTSVVISSWLARWKKSASA